MADLSIKLHSAERIILMGNGTKLFLDHLFSKSITIDHVVNLGDKSGNEVALWLIENLSKESLVVALGNIGGQGFSLVEALKKTSEFCSSSEFYLDMNHNESLDKIEGELIYD